MKHQKTYRKTIPAGGQARIDGAQGNFVFIAQGGNIHVVTDHSTTEMQAGDTQEFDSPFNEMILFNPTSRIQVVKLVIGFGRFNRNLVTGSIYSISGIIGADGQAQPDDRVIEKGRIALTNTTGENQVAGELAKNLDVPASAQGAFYYAFGDSQDGQSFKGASKIGQKYHIAEYSKAGGLISNYELTLGASPKANLGSSVIAGNELLTLSDSFASVYKEDLISGVLTQSPASLPSGIVVSQAVKATYIESVGRWVAVSPVSGGTAKIYTLTKDGDLIAEKTISSDDVGYSNPSESVNCRMVCSDKKTGSVIAFFYAGSSLASTVTINPLTLEVLTGQGLAYSPMPNDSTVFIDTANNFVVYDDSGAKRMGFLENINIKGFGYFSNSALVKILNDRASHKITASVQINSGGLEISGEIIKAALQLIASKYNAELKAEYLDYVYEFASGERVNERSGDESFARLGVVDNFTVSSLDKITIYYSKRVFK